VNREIFNEDALSWLSRSTELAGCSFVTSLPDISEFPALNLNQWKEWFVGAARLVLSRCPDDGVVIFYQTDILRAEGWIDKSYLCQKAAEETGHALLWHKVVCRVPAGVTAFGRSGYSHLLCFSRSVKSQIALSTENVLPHAGEVTWTRGMGVQACLTACRFILSHTATRTVVDPFCGHGTVLAVANSLGMSAIGVELVPKRAKKARGLLVEIDSSL
jgi:hypothetical protein